MQGNCAHCKAADVPCDMFDHESPKVIRFALCEEQCSGIFQRSQAIQAQFLACVLFAKDPTDNNDAARDYFWYKMSIAEQEAVNALNFYAFDE